MNGVCYCQYLLLPYPKPGQKLQCRFCCQTIAETDEYIYACFNKQCIHKLVTNVNYMVCKDCYNMNDASNYSNDKTDKISFIFNKIVQSLRTIS